jgi:hypothetical protein
MRRLIFSLFALSLVAMAVGCTHTAGQCDCDGNGNGKPHASVMPAAKPEQIKELPKDAPKETEQVSLETSEPPAPK